MTIEYTVFAGGGQAGVRAAITNQTHAVGSNGAALAVIAAAAEWTTAVNVCLIGILGTVGAVGINAGEAFAKITYAVAVDFAGRATVTTIAATTAVDICFVGVLNGVAARCIKAHIAKAGAALTVGVVVADGS